MRRYVTLILSVLGKKKKKIEKLKLKKQSKLEAKRILNKKKKINKKITKKKNTDFSRNLGKQNRKIETF